MAGAQSFNLLDEPWVRCRLHNGRVEELSLLDAFGRSREFAGLGGELPTQDAAVLRLMLAVLYRTIEWGDDNLKDQAAVQGWAAVWQAGEFPMDLLESYAATWRHRFDLLDPRMPFMQVADLRTASGKLSGLGKLIADVPDGHQFFTTRAREGISRLGVAEAARWLIHCQAFDPSGIKSGAIGDDRVTGGKGYPIGTGWAGTLGLLIVEGADLFETLLLNLDLRRASGPSAGAVDDLPVWEREPTGAGPDGRPGPAGAADILTWPSRRIRLFGDGHEVVDVLISNGDRVDIADQHHREPMSAWRRPKPQDPVYPRGHQAERALWRGFEATLRADVASQGKADVPPMLVQEWLAELVRHAVLSADRRLRFNAVGLVYGSNNSVIAGSIADSLELPLGVFERPELVRQIHEAVALTFSAVVAVGQLAGNLARARGGEPEDLRTPARERAYAVIDPHFRHWLLSLGSQGPADEPGPTWQRLIHQLLRDHGAAMVLAAGPRAAEGSFVTESAGGSPRLLDAGLAEKYFRAALLKALPQVAADYDDRRRPVSGDHPEPEVLQT